MPNVSVLSPDVIAKIAAGEVIDRPSSVIKELLENALDAGATAIEVHLKDAGKELIHIKDNGNGIEINDIEQLFRRHATSKITDINDLDTLNSMGFRGEALYSIAAVADITLTSQAAGHKDAWRIHLRGGKRLDLSPVAPLGQGTQIMVSELFFNTPARRKFLKNNAAETAHAAGIILPYALLYPEKRFLLTHAGRALLDLKPAPSRLDRAAAALGLEAKHLLETSQDFPQERLYIKALLSNINIQRPRRDNQFIFINNRPVESKALSFCLNDVYRMVLAPGIYPAFVLDIRLDPALVDVNVHPTKREVRIKDEAKLASILRRLVEYTLMRFGSAKTIAGPPTADHYTAGIPANRLMMAPGPLPAAHPDHPAPATAWPDLFDGTLPQDNLQVKFARARFIGAFINKYLLFEEGTSLLLVDQHAAQERIMFEKFTKQIDAAAVEIQPLLAPALIKLNVQEKINWEECAPQLKAIGIDTGLFDAETLAIYTQPLLLKNIENAVRTLLGGDAIKRADPVSVARRACKASIVTGDRLLPEQVEHQRRELLSCRDPFICPHGRPTVIELKESFLDRHFLRS